MHIHDERALIALQGPMASAAVQARARVREALVAHALTDQAAFLQGLTKLDLSKFLFGHFAMVDLAGIPCFVTRTGYTGEDGFEISVPNERALELTKQIMAHGKVHLSGACPAAPFCAAASR
jgi:aminomethyltransferase